MTRLEEGAIVLLLTAMTLLTFLGVILRYVFNTGLSWGLEATTYMFAWMVLVGIAYGVKVGFHIGVDAVVKLLPFGGRKVVGLIASGLCLLYAALMLIGGYNYIDTMYILGVEAEDIEAPRWLLSIILPVSFALLFWRLLQVAWRLLTSSEDVSLLGDEAAEVLRAHALETGDQGGERRP